MDFVLVHNGLIIDEQKTRLTFTPKMLMVFGKSEHEMQMNNRLRVAQTLL